MNKIKFYLYIVTLSIITLTYCSSIPKTEMKAARDSIAAARRVKAEKYAKVEIAKAEEKYKTSEAEVKNGDKEKAKTAALMASKIAREAYNKSITSFVNEESTSLIKYSKVAIQIHADKASPEKYNKASKTEIQLKANLKKLDQLREQLVLLEAKEKKNEK